jgi:PPOX class probable F420-dependent enzyme
VAVAGLTGHPDEARRLFASVRVARFATVSEAGRPHLVPCTFAVAGDLLYTAVDHKPKTTTNLQRLRNIRANPQVSMLADHYDEDWTALWWVRADGRASIIEDESAMTAPLDLLAARYPQYATQRPAGPVILIEVERWSGWSATEPPPPGSLVRR